MRASAAIFHSSPVSKTATASKETVSPPATIGNSQWHSPVPYLFGGLAAMLGLIAFALLILACSYWKLSGQAEDGGESGGDTRGPPPFEEKFLVIMAGDVKPTFLATPTSSRNSSFNDDHEINNVKDRENEKILENDEEFREIQLGQEYVETIVRNFESSQRINEEPL